MVQDAGKQKQAIRENLARKRRYLTKQEKQNRDAGLYKTVTNLPEWKKAQTVFIYVSTRYEASTKQLIKDFIKKKVLSFRKHILNIKHSHFIIFNLYKRPHKEITPFTNHILPYP